MSTLISGLPSVNAQNLEDNHLLIVEEVDNSISVETQKTTLQDLYEWISSNTNHSFNIKVTQVQSSGANIGRTVDGNNVVLNFLIPDYEPKYYNENDIVISNNCLYQCINSNQSASLDDVNWRRLGYNPGHYVKIEDGNVLSVAGVETWVRGYSYKIGDCVIYNKRLYQCLVANSDTVWTKNNWQNIGEGNGILIYENSKFYEKDSIVIYEDVLYKRKESGSDTRWNINNWTCISNSDYSVIYIKYSYDEPISDNEMSDVPNRYIGIYSGSITNVPKHYSDYSWYRIRGEDGNVNVEANCIVIEATLLASDWSRSAPYYQEVLDGSVTEEMYPIVDVVLSDNVSLWEQEKEAYSYIDKAYASNGKVTFYCSSQVPAIDVNVKIRINGDINEDSFVTKNTFNSFKSETQSAIVQLNNRISQNTTDINGLQDSLQIIVDKLTEFNMVDYKYWLALGEITTEYSSLAEILVSSDFDVLLAQPRSAAYAAYISRDISSAIKAEYSYLRKALLCENSEMFVNSPYDFDEHIDDYTEENPKVTASDYQGIVECSGERIDYGYYGYMAFDGSIDSNDPTVIYEDRHIWSMMIESVEDIPWIQYNYSVPKNLYKVRIYSVRDNTPLAVSIYGVNGQTEELIINSNLNIVLNAQNYTEIYCPTSTKYSSFKFVFSDSYYSGSCSIGEIIIYTLKDNLEGE